MRLVAIVRRDPPSPSLVWRTHIDGLRAVAVLSVLLYHVGVRSFRGGFVGVDVFFVISGFLISKIIYGEITEKGNLDFVAFYNRRIRRIIPVFVVVTGVCLAAGAALFLPDQLYSLGVSAVWAVAFAANIHFFLDSNYFAAAAETRPLLHYWSLGVEEQFYVFFPFIAWGVIKLNRGFRLLFLLIFIAISLASAQYYVIYSPEAAFYLPHLRAWEFLVGSTLALPGFGFPKRKWLADGSAAVGLALIILAILHFDQWMPFPGINAIFPVLGAGLIIWGCERADTVVGRGLSVFPLRQVGLWSYSIYMVHWPLIVYSKVWLYPTTLHKLEVIFASLSLGAVSYRFIETPFRKEHVFLSRRRVFLVAASVTAILVAFSGAFIATNGLAFRLPETVRDILAYNHYNAQWGGCFLDLNKGWGDLGQAKCLDDSHPSVLLWGDSHMADINIPLQNALKTDYPHISDITSSACPPILDLTIQNNPYCKMINDQAMEWIKQSRPDAIILSAFWPERMPWGKFYKTVRDITSLGIPVIVITQAPIYWDNVPNLIAVRELAGNYSNFDNDREHWGDLNDVGLQSHYQNDPMVRVVSLTKNLCDAEGCQVKLPDGAPVEFDQAHFTSEGAALAVAKMKPDLFSAIRYFKGLRHAGFSAGAMLRVSTSE